MQFTYNFTSTRKRNIQQGGEKNNPLTFQNIKHWNRVFASYRVFAMKFSAAK